MLMRLYHNPHCSKSRATLALLQDRGIEAELCLYLQNPPDHEELRELLRLLGIGPRDLMRKGEKEYRDHNLADLADRALTDAELIDALHRFPQLIERPILVAGDQARIGRPPESVIDII
ncbi:MAG: arsenate reductase (glutaredoxin) [Gammaproteobacteria bacterium]|nr:arsenate reductase (glutaredoxin) [Gammaproteobacteria bacterium]